MSRNKYKEDDISYELLVSRIKAAVLKRICDVPGEILICTREINDGFCEVDVMSSAFDNMTHWEAHDLLEQVLDEELSRKNRKQISDWSTSHSNDFWG